MAIALLTLALFGTVSLAVSSSMETEVNAYEWARDRFWRAIGGQ